MKKYELSIATCYINSTVTEEVEFEDDVTEEEVVAYWKEWVWEQLDGGYTEVDEE